MYFFSYLEPVCCSMASSNCCFLTCIQISQKAGQVVWYFHLFQNFPQFIVIHTIKVFGIVNKAEIYVFLKLSCFFYDPADVGNLISGSSALHRHHQMVNTKIRLIIFFAAKDGEALYSQQKQGWELTVAQIMSSLLPNSDFQMFRLVLEKAEEPEIKLPTSAESWKKQESSRKTSISALLTMPRLLTVWITISCGKF